MLVLDHIRLILGALYVTHSCCYPGSFVCWTSCVTHLCVPAGDSDVGFHMLDLGVQYIYLLIMCLCYTLYHLLVFSCQLLVVYCNTSTFVSLFLYNIITHPYQKKKKKLRGRFESVKHQGCMKSSRNLYRIIGLRLRVFNL